MDANGSTRVTQITVALDDSRVVLSAGSTELATYVFEDASALVESPRPYFHPVRTPGGDVVTIFRPHDHVWHRGISWAVAHVDDENFWGGPTYVPHSGNYEWLDNNGRMLTTAIDATTDRTGRALISHEVIWVARDGERMIHDERHITATFDGGDYWVLTFETRLTNETRRDIRFGSPTTHGRPDAGYGGLFWRGPRSFSGGRMWVDGASGGDELMGARGSWAAFSGRHDGSENWSTLLFLEDRTDVGAPNPWFARTTPFAGICAAPFFFETMSLPAGGSTRFSYSVVIADGPADDARLEQLASAARR